MSPACPGPEQLAGSSSAALPSHALPGAPGCYDSACTYTMLVRPGQMRELQQVVQAALQAQVCRCHAALYS